MNRKKIIIPLLIIFILFINILASTIYEGFISFAVDTEGESNVDVSVDSTDLNNIKITMGGNFDSNIVSIKYTDGGRVSKDEVIDYFNNSSNHIVDITNQNQGASPNVLAVTIENAIQGKEYTILVVFEDGTAHIGYATIGERTNGSMNIGYEYKSSVLTINVTSDPNNIVLLKIAKSSDISQISDFETKGEVISITPSTNVTATYEIKEEGSYKVYAKDSEGYTSMNETSYLTLTSTKTIKIVHKKDDSNALVIKAEDSEHKIIEMKIMLSDSEVSLEEIQNNGTAISITAGTKVQGEYTISGNNTYVTVYVKDEYGYAKICGQTINSIEEDTTIVVPVDPEPEPDPDPEPTPDPEPEPTPDPEPEPRPEPDTEPDSDQTVDSTPDNSQSDIVVPIPDDSNNGTSENENEIGELNSEDNTNTNLNIEDESNNLDDITNNQTNIKDNEQINSSNDESLPKTGVEDTGIILIIVTLLGIAIISFVKFIRIK